MSIASFFGPAGPILIGPVPADRPSVFTRASAPLVAIGVRIGDWMAAAILESRFRRAARELGQLDDRMLHDIGISRSEIDAVVRDLDTDEDAPMRVRLGVSDRRRR